MFIVLTMNSSYIAVIYEQLDHYPLLRMVSYDHGFLISYKPLGDYPPDIPPLFITGRLYHPVLFHIYILDSNVVWNNYLNHVTFVTHGQFEIATTQQNMSSLLLVVYEQLDHYPPLWMIKTLIGGY